jgi:DDE family transposase
MEDARKEAIMHGVSFAAQRLLERVRQLLPTEYQRDSLDALMGLFLQATGTPLPQHSRMKSPSALSRFLNRYPWSVRAVIRAARRAVLEQLQPPQGRGRRPVLRLILDLTALEKAGKFKGLNDLIKVLNGKRGLQLVMLYLAIGRWRIPWGFRVWRGKGQATPAELALKLVRTLPAWLKRSYRVLVLADAGFGSVEFLEGVKALGLDAVVGMRCDRRLTDGRALQELKLRGSRVELEGLSFPVYASWVWLKREGGKRELRMVISTRAMSGQRIARWGKRRWQIEGFFKTSKHRFGLHRFGQGTRIGVYRWLVLSLLAFVLAHWAHLSAFASAEPDWGRAARTALEQLLPGVLLFTLFWDLKQLQPILRSAGLAVRIIRCKI